MRSIKSMFQMFTAKLKLGISRNCRQASLAVFLNLKILDFGNI